MKTGPRSPAVSAALWAIGLCAGYVFGPLLLQIGAATGVSEKDLAMRLISAAFLFPLLFLGLWVYEKKKGRQHLANSLDASSNAVAVDSASQTSSSATDGILELRAPNKWNYVAIAVALFMLIFLFIPDIISGELENQYYLGAAFWVGVLIYCALNLKRSKARDR